ncbi:ATP-dependent Clp protease proteolytic subunit 1 [Variovorax sp. SRS16]|uniref:head maturation protease, ClpP-related n=1 Tax=Variovorax sp. SRS16 TaxID=282217 RepID=UPI001318EEAC|nr:head maturation protease, ClpP-related [Variovorax sp. SRS16]VTU16542.1 ATP-dependent Clp protease proteolytic subunit 1 [Variovorax sp. SRS16]
MAKKPYNFRERPPSQPALRFRNGTAAPTLEVFGPIGEGETESSNFKAELAKVDGPVLNIEINSYGGDLFAGVAIFNMLRGSGKTINVKVMGVAASAASIIAMAGDSIEMLDATYQMVHRASTNSSGNSDDLRQAADELEQFNSSLADIYARRTCQSKAVIEKMMTDETWLDPDEALAKGFATKAPGVKAKAPTPTPARSPEPARPEAWNAQTVTTLCGYAKHPQLAAGFIANKTPMADVRAKLLALVNATASTSTVSGPTTADVYRTRNSHRGKK